MLSVSGVAAENKVRTKPQKAASVLSFKCTNSSPDERGENIPSRSPEDEVQLVSWQMHKEEAYIRPTVHSIDKFAKLWHFSDLACFSCCWNISSWNVMWLYVLMCNFTSNKGIKRKSPTYSCPVACVHIWVWTDILKVNVTKIPCLDSLPKFLVYRETWSWLATVC